MMMIRMIGTAAVIALLCGASLHAQMATPAAPVEAVAFDPDAVNSAFARLSEDERYVIQQRLQWRGFYQGTVDGLTGPGTREAIRAQAVALLAVGQNVALDTQDGARTFLTGLLPMPTDEVPEGDAFFGVWDCEGSTFSYRYDGYATDPDAPHLPYMSIEEFTPGNFGITYMDGYRTGLMDVTPTTMIWSSPASGDIFDCRRVSGPPPRPEISTAVQSPSVEQVEAVPPAPPAGDAAQPSQSETKPDPVASDPETFARPFEGAWSCLSDTSGNDPMTFRFGPDFVTVPSIGSTVGYAEVARIGERDTAYLVDLLDGQQVVVVELEAGRMILFATGNIFDCSRRN
jgi:peptidoglycan hydrolase-like protein with peptidoglycan-binding domain